MCRWHWSIDKHPAIIDWCTESNKKLVMYENLVEWYIFQLVAEECIDLRFIFAYGEMLQRSRTYIQSSQMNKAISSSGRSFSSNKREPGADALRFRLSTSAVPLVQQTAAIINDRHGERQNTPGRRLWRLLFQIFADEDLLY